MADTPYDAICDSIGAAEELAKKLRLVDQKIEDLFTALPKDAIAFVECDQAGLDLSPVMQTLDLLQIYLQAKLDILEEPTKANPFEHATIRIKDKPWIRPADAAKHKAWDAGAGRGGAEAVSA
ncbi:hypothetical protein [Beijerinckia sp. L45]|uniref:hypothetical protein n=1 Tax=Beijerinckia sp. L45 TaxID=1641855 RepID=UPI00131BD77B|nr:hypothetical protein [Beijerinckia sp. L45]